ncbi:DUF2878 domain-containing protein [Ferrimonas aestuarii]|uniref:DUF2878 domain-containing protein n=1 Tax=Ferrimonas aestuarii TaxID=2569539 RepID=A0A4U1BQ70_9GAMM|nr:DUF2878 domain-containing protein [Ferrimonas aestuarii]TKB56556.1 DUF2878 domain-containing protein [Ferrimonas aestuarii]
MTVTLSMPTKRLLLDGTLFQLFWFASILEPSPQWQLAALLLWAWVMPLTQRQWLVVLGIACLGVAADSLFIAQGFISAQSTLTLGWIPLWLVLLWVGCSRYLLRLVDALPGPSWRWGLIGAVAGPLSYRGAEAFGIASVQWQQWSLLAAFILWWAVIMMIINASHQHSQSQPSERSL